MVVCLMGVSEERLEKNEEERGVRGCCGSSEGCVVLFLCCWE